jgi:DNA-binding NtrC family response regulator
VDVGARSVARRGAALRLEPKAFDLLIFLIEHSERCVLKSEIHAALWPSTHVTIASVPQLIKELRRQLGDDAEAPRIIRTLHGRGYQFVAPLLKTGQRARMTAIHGDSADVLPHLGSRVQRHLQMLKRAVSSGIPTLIVGEVGSGKQTLARALHRWSGGELSFISCPGLSAAELANAYPADPSAGREAPERNGVVLSGVTELTPDAQCWLLRRLEGQAHGEASLASNYVISTSCLTFRQLTAEGRFRADLLARLAGVTLCIPALRERPQELPVAVDYFARKYAEGRAITLSAEALAALAEYDWPLNLTQLEATVRALLWLQPAGRPSVTSLDVHRYLAHVGDLRDDIEPACFATSAE